MNMRIILLCIIGMTNTVCVNASQQTAGKKRMRAKTENVPARSPRRVTRAAAAFEAASGNIVFAENLSTEDAERKCPLCQFEFNTDEPKTVILKMLCCGCLIHLDCTNGYLEHSGGSYVSRIACPNCREYNDGNISIIRQAINQHTRQTLIEAAVTTAAPVAAVDASVAQEADNVSDVVPADVVDAVENIVERALALATASVPASEVPSYSTDFRGSALAAAIDRDAQRYPQPPRNQSTLHRIGTAIMQSSQAVWQQFFGS